MPCLHLDVIACTSIPGRLPWVTFCTLRAGCSLTFRLQVALAREVEMQQQYVQQLQEELSRATAETEAARQQLADASSLQSDAQVDLTPLHDQAKYSSASHKHRVSYYTWMRYAQPHDPQTLNRAC